MDKVSDVHMKFKLIGMSDTDRWNLNQPGFIDWKRDTPHFLIKELLGITHEVEWDGTMNMPILPLADPMHNQARRAWSL